MGNIRAEGGLIGLSKEYLVIYFVSSELGAGRSKTPVLTPLVCVGQVFSASIALAWEHFP
ncbi:MAG: hypothetical protein ACTSR2_06535 [Candidatus Hodarchaeales archaeon]